MKRIFLTLFAMLLNTVSYAAPNAKDLIPYQQFTLDNGLRVIVHEDHKTPKVAVSVWYHVGSKDEPLGKSGFAHLFEHLMFNGSENLDGEFFPPLQEIGASETNGTTWLDRTNYYETVPTGGLKRALWLESDRMGHLLGAITQAKLDEQRSVVQNEKRNRDNRPYGKMDYMVMEGLFPRNHPYHHSTIGSMEDLNNASLGDVKNWFARYYGAANALVVLAGDVTLQQAKSLMSHYFGHIPAGEPVNHVLNWVPERSYNSDAVMLDNVTQRMISWNWAVPGRTTEQAEIFGLLAGILGQGKTSRLDQLLVHDKQLATNVSASYEPHELASIFNINVTLKDHADQQQVEQLVESILQDLFNKGPSKTELEKVKNTNFADMIRAFESISVKARVLAESALYTNDPGSFNRGVERMEKADKHELMRVAKQWLSKGHFKLTVQPFGNHSVSAMADDRAQMPEFEGTSQLSLPELQQATLTNGIKVLFSQRETVPAVELSMTFDAGTAADSAQKRGVARFTQGLMNEGSKRYDAMELGEQQALLGARLIMHTDNDRSYFNLSALQKNLAKSIDLWADVILNPAFKPEDLARDKALTLSQIQRQLNEPGNNAWNTLNYLLYGSEHPYGVDIANPQQTVESFTRQDILDFYHAWFRPEKATIFVVGNTQLSTIMPLLEKHFGRWDASAWPAKHKQLSSVQNQAANKLVLIDKPHAVQSVIRVGHLIDSPANPDNFKIEAMNVVLGGGFNSRLNMNLREDKAWSYGAGSFLTNTQGQQIFAVSTSVQTDKTAEALVEIKKEVSQIRAENPITEQELALVVKGQVLSLPGEFEMNFSMLRYLQETQRFNRSYDYISSLPGRFAELSPEILSAMASQTLRPDALTWVVVGDLSKIESKVRQLAIADVEVWDALGNKLR